MNLGQRVKKRREELGISQEELALKMGYKSRSSINKIENGREVSQKIIMRLAEALKTTPSHLMGWEKEQKNNDTITDAIIRMRSDDEFLSLVEMLCKLDDEQLAVVKQLSSAFLK